MSTFQRMPPSSRPSHMAFCPLPSKSKTTILPPSPIDWDTSHLPWATLKMKLADMSWVQAQIMLDAFERELNLSPRTAPPSPDDCTSIYLPRKRELSRVHPPRPSNAFILFRCCYQKFIQNKFPEKSTQEVSKLLGEWWRSELESGLLKKWFREQARVERENHYKIWPDYSYKLGFKKQRIFKRF